MFEIIR